MNFQFYTIIPKKIIENLRKNKMDTLTLPDTRMTTLLATVAETEEYYERESTILAKMMKRKLNRVLPVQQTRAQTVR